MKVQELGVGKYLQYICRQFGEAFEAWRTILPVLVMEEAGISIVNGSAILRSPINTPYARTIAACRMLWQRLMSIYT